jgi:hypothetical protein
MNLLNTFRKLSRCSWNVRPIMITSSKYTRQELYVRPRNTVSISLSEVAGALQSPKGMTVNFHNPWPIEKSVFSLSSGCTCQ